MPGTVLMQHITLVDSANGLESQTTEGFLLSSESATFSDHMIEGSTLLPGVGYVELASTTSEPRQALLAV